jgi:SIR2-like protein
MLPAPSLDDLARRVRSRCDDSGGPYVLFLGVGCAAAAGAPSMEAIARDVLRTFGYDATPASADEPFDHLLSRFAERTDKLSRAQLTRMLRSVYAKVPVPSFYQDLALMVRERFFPIIVTTNFDTLLELALESVGLRNSDYLLTALGPRSRSESAPSRNLRPGSEPLTHIIKLHGDLAQDLGYLTPGEIEQALATSRQWIKADLSGDLIMVGHSPGEGPIDGWLAQAPQRELWWISPNDGVPPEVGGWSNDVHVLSGDLGRPQIFFQQLALRLLRAAEASEPAAAADMAPEANASLESTPPMVAAVREPDSLVDTLQREILRSQAVLTSLSQEAFPGTRSPETQAQIQYQKKRLTSLEDRLRLLPDVKLHLVELVDRILVRIRRVDSSTVASVGLDGVAAYVERETETLKRELGADTPNQPILSAALGATLTVADRLYTELGESAVNVDDLRALAALVPTSSGRVVP